MGKIPWRRKWQPTPVLLAGKSHGQRSLVGYSSIGLQRVGHSLATTNVCSLSLEWEWLSDAKTEDCHDLSVTHSAPLGPGRPAPCPLTQMTVRRSSPLAPLRQIPHLGSPSAQTSLFPPTHPLAVSSGRAL